jgi:hypothetical protein
MKDLFRYLEVPFDAPAISLARLVAFTTDHLPKLVLHNPGAQFNQRVTATTVALAAIQACHTDDITKLGARKACKLGKNAFRQALPGNITRLHAAVVAKYGPDAAQVVDCFPNGRGIFGDCPDDMVSGHLTALTNWLSAHQPDLGPNPAGDAGGLLSTWTALYAASESSTAAKASTEESRRNARLNLQLELFKNLLAIAAVYARQPEKLSLFMQQSLLEDHPRTTEEKKKDAA